MQFEELRKLEFEKQKADSIKRSQEIKKILVCNIMLILLILLLTFDRKKTNIFKNLKWMNTTKSSQL